jgi:hypothetical protein
MAIETKKLYTDAVVLALRDKKLTDVVANRDYEDEVVLNNGASVTVNVINKSSAQDLNGEIEYTGINGDAVTIKVDQYKGVPFKFSDFDKLQTAKGLFAGAIDAAAVSLAEDEDTYVLGKIAGSVTPANTIGTAQSKVQVVTFAQANKVLRDLKVKMEKNKVPKEGRVIVCPPEFESALTSDDATARALSRTQTEKDESVIALGYIGRLHGFDIYSSNEIAQDTVLATNRQLNTVIDQYKDTKVFTVASDPLNDYVLPVNLYGAEVVRPVSAKALVSFQ